MRPFVVRIKGPAPHGTSELILAGVIDRPESLLLEAPSHRYEVEVGGDDGRGIGTTDQTGLGRLKIDPHFQSHLLVADLVGVTYNAKIGSQGDTAKLGGILEPVNAKCPPTIGPRQKPGRWSANSLTKAGVEGLLKSYESSHNGEVYCFDRNGYQTRQIDVASETSPRMFLGSEPT